MTGSDENAIVVSIDADLEDIVPGYLQNRQNDVVEIARLLQGADFESIRVLGHRMKGSGGGYGFDRITEIGLAIENGGRDGDGEVIAAALDDLKDYLGRVEVVYQN